MTREEIFNYLAAGGFTRMEVAYSGGNDEGEVERPEFFWIAEHPPTPMPRALVIQIEEFCSGLIWEDLGHTCKGEGGCYGRLVWKVATRQILDKGCELVETPFEREV
jgi:hypothetical protein